MAQMKKLNTQGILLTVKKKAMENTYTQTAYIISVIGKTIRETVEVFYIAQMVVFYTKVILPKIISKAKENFFGLMEFIMKGNF